MSVGDDRADRAVLRVADFGGVVGSDLASSRKSQSASETTCAAFSTLLAGDKRAELPTLGTFGTRVL